MDNTTYQQLNAHREVLEHWAKSQVFIADPSIHSLVAINNALGMEPVNLSCSACKGALLTRLYNALVKYDKENSNGD